VGLHGTVDDPRGHLGDGDLDRRDLHGGTSVADRIHQPGGLEHQQPSLLDPDPALGDPLLHHSLRGEGLAERHTLLHPGAHEVVRTLGHADQSHAVVDPARAQSCLADGEPTVPLAQEVVARHSHRVIHDLGVPAVRAIAIAKDMG